MCEGTDSKWRLVGISIVGRCDETDGIHILIRVSQYRTFITEAIQVADGKTMIVVWLIFILSGATFLAMRYLTYRRMI